MASFKNMGLFVSIYVQPVCKPENYRRTMCHEMCHFYSERHDEVCERKLREVADGEPWLNDELAQLARWWVNDKIKAGWLEIVFRLAEENPNLGWVAAQRTVAHELNVKVAEVRDVVWNFKQEWFDICQTLRC